MFEPSDPRLDMIAAVISVFVLTADREEFGFMHMIMGVTLILFILPSFRRHNGIRVTAVLALLLVLVLGKPLDWLRDSYFRDSLSRDVTFSVAWVFLAIVLLILPWVSRRIGLKQIKAIGMASLIIGVALMAMGQQYGTTPATDEPANSTSTFQSQQSCEAIQEAYMCTGLCQSYHVIEAESLPELKDEVQRGIGKPGWLPQGGITCDVAGKCYLQVMVHPRKLTSYP